MAAKDALTKNQLRVLEKLEAAGGPLSAYTLLDQLRDHGFRAPLQVYRALDILVKGGDYTAETTAGAGEVIANGGRFVAIPFEHDRSTTSLVDRIRNTPLV